MKREQIEQKAKEIAKHILEIYPVINKDNLPNALWFAAIDMAEWLLENEKVNADKAILWFNDIAEMCSKLTSGNVSHLAATIKGMAIRSAEYVEKHRNDNPWISVEDELPNEDRILAVLNKNFCGKENCVEVLYRIDKQQTDLKHPYGYYDEYGDYIPTNAITHWMPIPKLNEK